MSFLTNVEEEMLTLEAALEFIESCGDDADQSSDSVSDSPAATRGSASRVEENVARPASAGKQKGASVDRKLSTSTEQQRRRKQEILSLREQAVELEAHLSQLKRRHSRRVGTPSGGEDSQGNVFDPQLPGTLVKRQKTSVWMDLATIQCRERQRAELTNRKLKAIWVSQSKMNAALQQILQKRSAFAGRELVFDQPPLYKTPSSAYVGVSVMSELEKQMRSLYLESETVFRPAGDCLMAVTCSTETRYEPGVGTFVELRTTTPMSFTLEQTTNLIWNEVNSKRKYPDKTYEIKPGSDANSAEKNFVWSLRDGDHRKVRVNGLQYVRRYDETNRVVIVWSTLLLLSTSGVKFRDRTWIVVTPSPEDPVHKSVIRLCFRVYTEPEAAASFNRADLEYLRNFVSGTLISSMRVFAQIVQNAMLEFSNRQELLHNAASSTR